MKKLMLVITVVLLAGTFAMAQRFGGDSDQIQKMREEFFNQELQLTPEESKAFWPIYHEFKADQEELNRSFGADRKMELMTDAEAEKFIEEHLDLEENQLKLKRQYINKLKAAVSVRKIAMINRTERKFKQTLLKRLKDRPRENQKRRGFN